VTYLALSPVSAAIYAALNVAGLTALATGGIYDDVPQGTSFPQVVFTVSENQQLGGFGTYPGTSGRLPEIALRVYVFTKSDELNRGMKPAQVVMSKVIELLRTPPAVSGFSSWAIFWDDVNPVGDELVAGVKVKELTANARLYVEAA